MRKRNTLILAFSLALVALAGLLYLQTNSPTNQEREEELSGAYQALIAFGAQRAYPNTQFPARAHYAAWEKSRTMASNRSTTAPWESLGPLNFSGRTLALAFNPDNPNTLYAGSASGGLWRSHTAGVGATAWEYVETGFPVLGVGTIAIAPADSNTIYIGTGEVYNYEAAGTGAAYRSTRGSYGIGILKTTDGGATWEKSLDWSYNQNHGVWAIRIFPDNPDIVYAATTEGVYKSTDAGDNWTKVLDVVMATDLLIHPDDPDLVVVGCGNFSSPGFGIYQTTDGGSNWDKMSSDLPTAFNGKIMLGMAPSQPNTIYASIGNGFGFNDGATWLCRSDDFGINWEVRSTTDYSRWQGWFAHDVDVHPTDPDRLFAIGISVWNSNNGGNNLTERASSGLGFDSPPIEGPDGPPSYIHSDCHYVLYHPVDHDIVYIANDGGIHRTTDGGLSFESCNGGMQTVQFYNGFSNSFQDSTFCIGGLQDNGTIFLDGDKTWTRVFGGDGSWTAVDPTDDNTFFISYQNLNMFKTTDGGQILDWAGPDADGQNIAFIAPYAIAQSDPFTMYAGASKLYKTPSAGNFWFAVNNDEELDGNPILSLDISAQNSDVVYVATAPLGSQRGNVYVLKDGINPINITGDLPDRYPMDITVDPTDEATAYITFSGYGTGHVFMTNDYGENWTDISDGLPDVPANAVIVDPLFPNNVYVGNDLGVYVSEDYGTTWSTYQEGLPTAVMIFDLKISPSNRKLRIASHGNGAYERDLIEVGLPPVSTQDALLAGAFTVGPNPLQNEVFISYELANKAEVVIQIMDNNGRLVQQLTNESQVAGEYNSSFPTEDWANGAYYCQLIIDGKVRTKKLIKSN
ncbi:MAG: T9SS type A sorting domain-containing protein [Bacteroidota bacterium]